MAVVGTLFLPAMDPHFSAVHIQHDPRRRSDGFHLGEGALRVERTPHFARSFWLLQNVGQI